MQNNIKIIFLVCFYIVITSSKLHQHAVPSYFRKTDENGDFLHRESVEYEKDIPKHLIQPTNLNSDVVLKVTPEIANDSSSVNISWNGILNPQEKDFIALYCPANDKLSHYLDFLYVSDCLTWEAGYGEFTVVVYHMFQQCQFKYLQNNGGSAVVLGVSNILKFTGGQYAALQGHIALTGDPTEMRIMWTTGTAEEPSFVRYGITKDLERKASDVIYSSYKAEDMCEGTANSTGFWFPGIMVHTTLKDLRPNTKYYFTFGSEKYTSKMYNFTTGLPRGNTTSYKFICYGDQGLAPYPQGSLTAKRVIDLLQKDPDIRFVYHHGDISYARGLGYIWNQYMSQNEPYATHVPYMVGVGNHEQDHLSGGEHDPSGAPGEGFHPRWGNYGTDSGGECGVPMYHRFKMPENGNNLWWYSYDYGLAHYIMFSTEHDFTPGSRQYAWIENDLRNVDRTKTPWVIVAGHRAMYCSALIPDDYVVSLNMQLALEEIFYKYKVDVAFWAHYHSYERTCKIYRNKCQEDGIQHIVVGNAGRDLDPDIWLPKKWSIKHVMEYGFGVMHVVNSTALHWKLIENKSDKVIDELWLHK